MDKCVDSLEESKITKMPDPIIESSGSCSEIVDSCERKKEVTKPKHNNKVTKRNLSSQRLLQINASDKSKRIKEWLGGFEQDPVYPVPFVLNFVF